MPGGLPAGLVTTTDNAGDEIGQADEIDLDTIARFWRTFSATRALHHDEIGERLTNFFWRIWGNPSLRRTITEAGVTRQFTIIQAGGNRIRTTPIPSPRPTSPVSHGDSTPTPSSPQLSFTPPISTPRSESDPSVPTSPKTSRSPQSARRPPSILKNGRNSSSETQPTSVSFGQMENEEPVSPHQQSRSPGSGPLSPASLQGSDKPSLDKKKTSFVTASARAKTRPTLPKRRSAQGSNVALAKGERSPRLQPKRTPPIGPVPKPAQERIGELPPGRRPPPGLPSLPQETSGFALPSASSWQDVGSVGSSDIGTGTSGTSLGPPASLVETDFRKKFAENKSQTNLSGLGRLGKSGSMVRFKDDVPERLEQDDEGIDKMEEKSEHALVSPSEELDEEAVLPRTKSQLSMLIAHARRKSSSHELPGPSSLQQGQNDCCSKAEKNQVEDEKEDGLLMMGRKDGVTKAGGLSSVARGKRMMGEQIEPEKFAYQSPPTPPLF